MKIFHQILQLLYPPKCVLCRKLLQPQETDLCAQCRADTPEVTGVKRKFPHLANWTALWYYEGSVRASILRYKFRGSRSYCSSYGRLLAMKLLQESIAFDILTWVPISPRRKWRRGYDQVELIARAAAKELGIAVTPTLRKIRHNRPQSTMKDAAARRANVLGVYRVTDPAAVAGKRILVLDDILTTGATLSECARTLLTAGAKEVNCATVAVASHQRHNSR